MKKVCNFSHAVFTWMAESYRISLNSSGFGMSSGSFQNQRFSCCKMEEFCESRWHVPLRGIFTVGTDKGIVFFFNTKFIRAPRFWGCFFKDRNASQHIERKKVALVKTWHTRQGVYRKKIQPDVRDDLRSLRHLQEGATSWRSTYESWVALSVEFHLVLTHRYSWEFPPRVFLFFFVVFVWLLVAFDFKLSQAFCIFPCMKSLQQDKSGNDRQCLSHDL